MKSIKMLALAALAALVAMALVSASSAMATGNTALCGADQATCASPLTHVHETSVTKMKLLTTFPTVECDVLFLGDALNSGLANPLVIHGTFTYTNCGSCTVTEQSGPAEIKVLKEGHETAKVSIAFLTFFVECGSSLSCTYIWLGTVGTGKGPLLATQANGEVSFVKQSPTVLSGLLCPGTNKLDLTTTPLSATYISQ